MTYCSADKRAALEQAKAETGFDILIKDTPLKIGDGRTARDGKVLVYSNVEREIDLGPFWDRVSELE